MDNRKLLNIIFYILALAISIIVIHQIRTGFPKIPEKSGRQIFIENLANHDTERELKYRAEILNAFTKSNENNGLVEENNLKFKPKPTENVISKSADLTEGRPADQSEPKLDKNKPRVLIMTHHRSGSSFTGELFNQHPDVFYMYDLGMKIILDSKISEKDIVLDAIFRHNPRQNISENFETIF